MISRDIVILNNPLKYNTYTQFVNSFYTEIDTPHMTNLRYILHSLILWAQNENTIKIPRN